MTIEARALALRRPPQQNGRGAPPSATFDTPRRALPDRTDSARASRTARSSLGKNRSWSSSSRLTGRIEAGFASGREPVTRPIGERTSYKLKLSPQPHSSFTFGLLNLKPSFKPSRVKSSSVPSRYGMLFGSTITVTPWLWNRWSSGRMSSAYSSLYASPEHPVVRTPRRKPTPFPRLVRNFATWLAAVSVSDIVIVVSGNRGSAGGRILFLGRRSRIYS